MCHYVSQTKCQRFVFSDTAGPNLNGCMSLNIKKIWDRFITKQSAGELKKHDTYKSKKAEFLQPFCFINDI